MALTDKLTNIADAIRNKTETAEPMTLDEMSSKIESIETKSEPKLQDKTIEITENGTQRITADEGYDGLKNVSVTTNVAGSGSETFTINDGSYLFTYNSRKDEIEKLLPLCTEVTSLSNMFKNSSAITNITGFANYKNENAVSTIHMFSGCTALTTIDFGPNTEINSNDVSNMFNSCQNLQNIDLSGVSFSKGTTVVNMFNNCQKLQKLDLSHFDFSAVTVASQFAVNCYALEEIDISSWDLATLTTYTNMFRNCGTKTSTGLTTVYVKDQIAQDWVLNTSNGRPSNWSTANVIIKG